MNQTPHVSFDYNQTKDIENIKIGLQGVQKGRNADQELKRILEQYGNSVTDEELALYLDERWKNKEESRTRIVRQMQEHWDEFETRFFCHLTDCMQIIDFVGVKNISGYFSLRHGSGYNAKENWFAVSAHNGLFRNTLTAMHEIMHIFFHKSWWHVCEEAGLTEKNIWDVKEAVTVLLNLWFKDDLIDFDFGYEEHTELRHLIKEWFIASQNFKETVLKACEYMKVNSKNQWTQEEWNEFEKKLENLSIEELKEIADATDLKFFTDNIRKEDYINALDESDKDRLIAEYKKILSRKIKK